VLVLDAEVRITIPTGVTIMLPVLNVPPSPLVQEKVPELLPN
jgi:hypothetical protein